MDSSSRTTRTIRLEFKPLLSNKKRYILGSFILLFVSDEVDAVVLNNDG